MMVTKMRKSMVKRNQRTKSANIFDTAKYILQHTGSISTWKLQKLCYYAQAWSLAWTGEPIFKEDFQAWRNGPVCPELFEKHKGLFWVNKTLFDEFDENNLTADQKDTIDNVLSVYGNMEPYQLRAQTHSEKPWQQARTGLTEMEAGHKVITKEAMGNYYGEL